MSPIFIMSIFRNSCLINQRINDRGGAVVIKKKVWVRQLLLLIPTFLFISFISFAIIYHSPGDAGKKLLTKKSGSCRHTQEQIDEFTERLDLPENMVIAYSRWISGMVKGDMGRSNLYSEPVKSVIARHALNTASLVGIALVFYLVSGIYIGFMAGAHPGGVLDRLSHLWATLNLSLPTFWLATVVLWLTVKLFPNIPVLYFSGFASLGVPGVLMGFLYAGNLMKLLRDRVLRISEEEFVSAAQIMGLSNRQILWKHIFTNALPTIISVVALDLPLMMMGSLVIEKIFSIPGIGSLLLKSINAKDYFLIAGCVFYICIIVAICNFLAELVYPLIDRRRT